MRLSQYIIEAKKFKYYTDNPGGGWLDAEIERAKRSKLGGAVTAGFHDFIQIPTMMLNGLRGMQGEHEIRKLTDPDVQDLLKAIKVEGIYSPIFINVQWDGEPMINEGNRRAMIAKELKFDYVPIELKYFAGGERKPGPFSPENIMKVGKPWKRPPKPPSILKIEKEWRERQEKKTEEPPKIKIPEKGLTPELEELMDLILGKK